ncbi:MAG: DEAD/DEAH box helicase [Puniceicoccales bacterium]|nr:DEAD/DEAH box helicase [Puniceicoccales bacterium]
MADDPTFFPSIDGSTQYLGVKVLDSAHPLRAELVQLLKQNGFQLDVRSSVWRLRDRHRVLSFLAEHGQTLRERFRARFTPEFFQRTANISTATLATEASPRTDGAFDFHVRIDAAGVDAATLHLALARNHVYTETPNGKIVLLPPDVLRAASALARALNPDNSGTPQAETRRVARIAELADIENTLDSLAVPFTPPQTWRERSAALRSISALRPAPIPPMLENRLRLYQQIGVAWLWHLHTNGLGGVLADEMGLGKTVQALAFLRALFSNGNGEADGFLRALVVCPSVLLENWRREAANFIPDIATRVHHGTARARSPEAFHANGIIITSYGTLTRDLALFREQNWTVIVADEAQHVKNRRSQNARSLRTLHAKGRFALTGTPVENDLDDLRSLFAFLMPGYLPNAPSNDRVGTEQRRWRDQRDCEKVAPYILRRAKRAVAPELPEKIEQTVFVELEDAQKTLYDGWRDRARSEIFEMEMSGSSDGRLRTAAFTHLLRLRQICAEPRILAPELTPADSAKLRALREILDEAADGAHRTLVFSQFVEVLRHLRDDLDAAGVPSCYMDGSTRDRQAECDRFNSSSVPVFLISLKTGGTGLNLTGADTVVHFDPWWNPAVEAQASDRAHRIGQKRVVTILKLIAASTVEERVLELQHKKAALLRDLFSESDAAIAKISIADLKNLFE